MVKLDMSRIFTGPKAIVKLDNFPILFASGINITSEMVLEEINQLDDLEVVEFAEAGHKVSFSVSIFKIEQQTAKLLGLEWTNINDILTQPELIVEVFNDTTGVPVYTLTGVKFQGGSGEVSANGIWTGQWNFRARRGIGL